MKVANGFGRRPLHEWEVHVLHDTWRLSAGGVPVPPPASAKERCVEIASIRASFPEHAWQEERHAADNFPLSTSYFQHRHADQLASTKRISGSKGAPQLKRPPSVVGRTRAHAPRRTQHIESSNEPPLEYPALSLSRWSGSSWLLRRWSASAALKEIAALRRGREEGGIIVHDNTNEETPAQSNPVRSDDLGQGCNKDDGDNDEDDDDYTAFYQHLDMN
ncbi:hypothetical protein D1007_09688 [Hordeum vulgare]|nr:hypothetical protein D1007_09688 [Hordeum vulgare]